MLCTLGLVSRGFEMAGWDRLGEGVGAKGGFGAVGAVGAVQSINLIPPGPFDLHSGIFLGHLLKLLIRQIIFLHLIYEWVDAVSSDFNRLLGWACYVYDGVAGIRHQLLVIILNQHHRLLHHKW